MEHSGGQVNDFKPNFDPNNGLIALVSHWISTTGGAYSKVKAK